MTKPIDNVGITFVNRVLGQGYMNGVVNVQLGVLPFDINEDGTTVNLDAVVACRLRMDEACAERLVAALQQALVGLREAQQKTMQMVRDSALLESNSPAKETAH